MTYTLKFFNGIFRTFSEHFASNFPYIFQGKRGISELRTPCNNLTTTQLYFLHLDIVIKLFVQANAGIKTIRVFFVLFCYLVALNQLPIDAYYAEMFLHLLTFAILAPAGLDGIDAGLYQQVPGYNLFTNSGRESDR